PAGPAPTITTSNSMLSRSGSSVVSVIHSSPLGGTRPSSRHGTFLSKRESIVEPGYDSQSSNSHNDEASWERIT
ncbi:hypothetical protein AB9E19_32755, partial [Rhizobium leguminosarum]|uniref:hypothetical protein n=1 Tax=Rhizobium leguminosarum TaxID=384 RepID=UPI003F9AA6A5